MCPYEYDWPRFYNNTTNTDNIMRQIPTKLEKSAIWYIIPLAFG